MAAANSSNTFSVTMPLSTNSTKNSAVTCGETSASVHRLPPCPDRLHTACVAADCCLDLVAPLKGLTTGHTGSAIILVPLVLTCWGAAQAITS